MVIARLLERAKKELSSIKFSFMNHCRRSKKRRLEILNAKNPNQRRKPYRDLIKLATRIVEYAESALADLESYGATSINEVTLLGSTKKDLLHYLPLVRQVICQTKRRVIDGESVPASEKLVSIFEEHTDIIRKDQSESAVQMVFVRICLTLKRMPECTCQN